MIRKAIKPMCDHSGLPMDTLINMEASLQHEGKIPYYYYNHKKPPHESFTAKIYFTMMSKSSWNNLSLLKTLILDTAHKYTHGLWKKTPVGKGAWAHEGTH